MSGIRFPQKDIIECHRMLDLIRVFPNERLTVEALREALSISRATADKQMQQLLDNEIVYKCTPEQYEKEKRDDPNETYRRLRINGSAAHFVGISCGSEHTRVVICDLTLRPIQQDIIENEFGIHFDVPSSSFCPRKEEAGYSFETPHGFLQLQKLISHIISAIISATTEDAGKKINLMGIGFAVAGPVNYARKAWLSAPRIDDVINVSIADLTGHGNYNNIDNAVFLSIDNNAKTTVISEYQYLYEKNHGNYCGDTAALYVGSGLGLGIVINNRLIRGTNNYAGEIGYSTYFYDNQKITTFEKRHREITKSLQKPDANLEEFYHFLVCLINNISCIFSPEHIVLTGHSIDRNEKFIQAMRDRRSIYTSPATKHSCKIDQGRNNANTAAIGAAIEAYFCMCSSALSDLDDPNHSHEDRTNLASDISWI